MSELIKVSFNQLLTWDRCRFRWYLGTVEKWTRVERRIPMELGNLGHKMLFDYYSTGIDHSEEMANALLADWENLDAESVTAISTALSLFRIYVDVWSPEHDRRFLTQTLEEHFEVELITPAGNRFILEGYIDRSSIDPQGNLWVEDYKWTQRFWTPTELLMDPQLAFYGGALRALGRPVHGLMITQVNTYPYKNRNKKKPEELIRRDKIYRSPKEFDAVMWEIGLAVDDLIANRDNPRRSLRKDCSKCDFQEPCLFGLKGMDVNEVIASSGAYRKKDARMADDDPMRQSILSSRLLEASMSDIEIVDEPIEENPSWLL